MYAAGHRLVGNYHVAELRAQARREVQARVLVPTPFRSLARKFTR